MRSAFFDREPRVLTASAFEFVLDGELRRALRSQNFVTLVVLDTRRDGDTAKAGVDAATVDDVAAMVESEVRDTDPLGRTSDHSLALLLIDADFDDAARVLDRLAARIDDYEFTLPLRISVGAACYPTHAVDARSLKVRAASRPVACWRGERVSHERHHQ
jgi:GGDEF domain-containing protein